MTEKVDCKLIIHGEITDVRCPLSFLNTTLIQLILRIRHPPGTKMHKWLYTSRKMKVGVETHTHIMTHSVSVPTPVHEHPHTHL